MKKVQLSIYLDPEIFASLEAYAQRQGKPKSLVAEAAIGSFLSPDDSDRREAAIAKRLDRIVRVLERLERNDGITLETIALFIRFWLTSTPALHANRIATARISPSLLTCPDATPIRSRASSSRPLNALTSWAITPSRCTLPRSSSAPSPISLARAR